MDKSKSIKDLPREEYLRRLKRRGMTEAEFEARLKRQDEELPKLLNRKSVKQIYPDFPGLSGDLHRAAMAEWYKEHGGWKAHYDDEDGDTEA